MKLIFYAFVLSFCCSGSLRAQVPQPLNEFDPYVPFTNNFLLDDTLYAPFALKIGMVDSFRFTEAELGSFFAGGTIVRNDNKLILNEIVENPNAGRVVYRVVLPLRGEGATASRDTGVITIAAPAAGLSVIQQFVRSYRGQRLDTIWLTSSDGTPGSESELRLDLSYDSVGRKKSVFGFDLSGGATPVSPVIEYRYRYDTLGRLGGQDVFSEGDLFYSLEIVQEPLQQFILSVQGEEVYRDQLFVGAGGELDSLVQRSPESGVAARLFRVDDGTDELLRRYVLTADVAYEFAYYYSRLSSTVAERTPLIDAELRFANPASPGTLVQVTNAPNGARYRLYDAQGRQLAAGTAERDSSIELPQNLGRGLHLLVLEAAGFEARAWKVIVQE